MDGTGLAISLAKAGFVAFLLLNAVPLLVWLERRGAAFIQDRIGPNRTSIAGFALAGLVQPLADVVKFMFKEDFVPPSANRTFYLLAPIITLIPALMTFAVVPFADVVRIGERLVQMQVADLNVGILYVFAIASLGVYGVVLAGWASNNKYSFLGSVRASAQMISYELSMGLSVLGLVMVFGTLQLDDMVRAQGARLFGVLPLWGIVLQPLGFLLFVISVFAETNRLPFDLAESEAELVVGYHTEYSSMKFATFFMAEYIAMTTGAALIVSLFLGGWQVPFVSSETLNGWTADLLGPGAGSWLAALIQFGSFSAKLGFFLWLFIWVRWTLPRFRYDQLMRLGWKVMLPLALANLLVTAAVLLVIDGAAGR
ncbi:MAG: NADH-quinone oxidoreductase subunit NuoH [Gemmatimonadetes bacterium]|nr:NADH-quinone oxidoreductase subunit NuoH [Gemmatimonadota bacterium]